MGIKIIKNDQAIPILVESSGFEGVKKIAETVAEDIELVTGKKPELVDEKCGINMHGNVIMAATLGKSPLLDHFSERGLIDAEKLSGKREVYQIKILKQSETALPNTENVPDDENLVLIAGSDKRGTIYGLFALSEYLGVSPLVFWGDAAPERRPDAEIGADIEVLSKEPSVRYRGFFINDEWPCFGTWVTSHYGDFNAKAYKYVFEFLLRMKGNYMWPAMWTASFPLDGPGSANEELADMYGVVMGYSHHEPCLRASEEWDKVRGEGTRYGNEWNFYTNEEGLLNYWEDSLKRSGKYENIITIGMRGERDSSMLGENATIEQNVNLLKDIITKQRRLIKKYVNEDLAKVPQMLALYKEVEAYFYGDENVQGLKDWEELDGVICMLCEDNFGHMRTLPTEEIRNHKGGFGMYYHFDYHGDPISYEWVDSTPLSKTWEQMCNAYEYGIRDLWIVNVGDLKFHEVPLTYFMALAYDYEKWGISNPDSYREYTKKWAGKTFPGAEGEVQDNIAKLLTEYLDLVHLRRPESLNESIYHPCNYLEADRMIEAAKELNSLSEKNRSDLPECAKEGYYSMLHFSVSAYVNLLLMHLYAAKNHHYAKQGRPVANLYAEYVRECIRKDRELADEFGAFKGGKWNGMQLAPHIGFTKWNEDGCKYPYVCTVEPVGKPRLSVSRADEEKVHVKNYGSPSEILVEDFLSEGIDWVYLEACNDGIGELEYRIEFENGDAPAWLFVSPIAGKVRDLQRIELRFCKEKLAEAQTDAIQNARMLVASDDTTVAVNIFARRKDYSSLPEKTWLPQRGAIVMDACGYYEKQDVSGGGFCLLQGYGKYQNAMKVFPVTADFSDKKDAPSLSYRFLIEEKRGNDLDKGNSLKEDGRVGNEEKKNRGNSQAEGRNAEKESAIDEGKDRYRIILLSAPTNPTVNHGRITLKVTGEDGQEKEAVFVDENFRPGNSKDKEWCRGVLDQIRCAFVSMDFSPGVHSITVSAAEPMAVLERIIILKDREELPESYLGPERSVCSV